MGSQGRFIAETIGEVYVLRTFLCIRHPDRGGAVLTIHHIIPKTNYTVVPNEIKYNERLSVLARHVLEDLIGRPPGWQSNADRMWQQARKARGDRAEGRRAWREAWNDLEKAGYLVRRRVRVGSAWEMHVDVYSTPQTPEPGNPADSAGGREENPADPAPPPALGGTGFGPSETGTSLVSTETPSTESSSADAGSPLRADRESSSVLTDGSTASSGRHFEIHSTEDATETSSETDTSTDPPATVTYKHVKGRAKHRPWDEIVRRIKEEDWDEWDLIQYFEEIGTYLGQGQENMVSSMFHAGSHPKAILNAVEAGC